MSDTALLIARAHEAIAHARWLAEKNIRTIAQSVHVTACVRLERARQAEVTTRESNGYRETTLVATAASRDRSDQMARLTAAIARLDQERARERAQFERALASRDIIGQTKGLIIAACRCSSDEAFALLRRPSQHENRKLVEVATEIVEQAQRSK